ncbi:hypothetical protein CCY99_01480 [Helicobacter sp. 16-1353]|uniref:formate dehydrogenase accessory sulfurtransferase FdhD n=1 Tax=Helicobacter sp. 16-1353 TaxID=2004996 RepID=UPI000DCC73F2|nr:formate dehydrogenase accessory sulfurtransferase FdhD [Helicobacter sp. 16-1353]RAX54851.1 hypothetical protein CCY99_01480 [Helicobacter sp. 16-1353]
MLKHITIKSIKKGIVNEIIESFYNDTNIKVYINDYLEIMFICLDNDLEPLVRGYLSNIKKDFIQNIVVEKNSIFVQVSLKKDEFLNLLKDREVIQTCESITLTDNLMDNKRNKDKVIIPFNNSRRNIHINDLLESCRDFYNFDCSDSYLCRSKIVFLGNNGEFLNIVESYDINPKNAVYKAIGLAKTKRDELLDSIIFINFRLDVEILKKIILSKITFIVFIEKPSFAVLRFAQKFGLTLSQYIPTEEMRILTHSTRIN